MTSPCPRSIISGKAVEITDRSAGLARAVHTAYNGALVTWGNARRW